MGRLSNIAPTLSPGPGLHMYSEGRLRLLRGMEAPAQAGDPKVILEPRAKGCEAGPTPSAGPTH